MQFLKVAHELITDKNITSNEFRIYAYLMSLYNKAKKCSYPSIEVVAEKTNISVSTVKRSIKKLVIIGYMKITKRAGINGNYNEYSEFKFLVSDKNSISTKSPVEEILVEEKTETNKNTTNETMKQLIVSDCKESGLQMTIDEVEEVKVKQHPNNSRIAKETKIKLTPFYCQAFSLIDEIVLTLALKEKAKSAYLLLIKCIRLTKQIGLEFCKEFINKVLKFKDYKDEYDLTSENNELYLQYINKKYGIAN